jgi:hypothetical protein
MYYLLPFFVGFVLLPKLLASPCLPKLNFIESICNYKDINQACNCYRKKPLQIHNQNSNEEYEHRLRSELIWLNIKELLMLGNVNESCNIDEIELNQGCSCPSGDCQNYFSGLVENFAPESNCKIKNFSEDGKKYLKGLSCIADFSKKKLTNDSSCIKSFSDSKFWMIIMSDELSEAPQLNNVKKQINNIIEFLLANNSQTIQDLIQKSSNLGIFFKGYLSSLFYGTTIEIETEKLHELSYVQGFKKDMIQFLKKMITFDDLSQMLEFFLKNEKQLTQSLPSLSKSICKQFTFDFRNLFCSKKFPINKLADRISSISKSVDSKCLNTPITDSFFSTEKWKDCLLFRSAVCSHERNKSALEMIFGNNDKQKPKSLFDIYTESENKLEESFCGTFRNNVLAKCGTNKDSATYKACIENKIHVEKYVQDHPNSLLGVRSFALGKIKDSDPALHANIINPASRLKGKLLRLSDNGELTPTIPQDSNFETTSALQLSNRRSQNFMQPPTFTPGESYQTPQFTQLNQELNNRFVQLKKAESDLARAETAAQRDKFADELAELRRQITRLKEEKDKAEQQAKLNKKSTATVAAEDQSTRQASVASTRQDHTDSGTNSQNGTRGLRNIADTTSDFYQGPNSSNGFIGNAGALTPTTPAATTAGAAVAAALPPLNQGTLAQGAIPTNGVLIDRNVPAKQWNEMLSEIQSFKAGNEELKKENALAIDVPEEYAQKPEGLIKEKMKDLKFDNKGVAYVGLVYRKAENTKAVYYRIEKNVNTNGLLKVIELGKQAHEDIRTFYLNSLRRLLKN